MSGQFDKETTNQNYEWNRKRLLKEAEKPSGTSSNRAEFLLRSIAEKHGEQGVREALKEYNSKKKR